MIDRFGATQGGQPARRITLINDHIQASVLTLGAILQDLRFPGDPHSLTLGFSELAPYEGDFFHVGSIVGPVANRIAEARAIIDGHTRQFDRNLQNRHTLHSGATGLQHQVWDISEHGDTSVELTLNLPDGLGGFPGNRRVSARFELVGPALMLTMSATTDKPTLMNPANHSYWNLSPNPTMRGHQLSVFADRYTPNDPETLIPTGAVKTVQSTRFDFRDGADLRDGQEGLLDLNFCLSDGPRPLSPAAQLVGPSGIHMAVSTTAPGLQIFDGHILGDAPGPFIDREPALAYGGLAIESQHWPGATSNPNFPSIALNPGKEWTQQTKWAFHRG